MGIPAHVLSSHGFTALVQTCSFLWGRVGNHPHIPSSGCASITPFKAFKSREDMVLMMYFLSSPQRRRAGFLGSRKCQQVAPWNPHEKPRCFCQDLWLTPGEVTDCSINITGASPLIQPQGYSMLTDCRPPDLRYMRKYIHLRVCGYVHIKIWYRKQHQSIYAHRCTVAS